MSRPLPTLKAFPMYSFHTEQREGKPFILDAVRRKWIRLTPEEWVRQHLLRALVNLGYPPGLSAVEKSFTYLGGPMRADVVVYDRDHTALLLAECKAPSVPVTPAVFDQVARYNAVVRAVVIAVTNGDDLRVGLVEAGSVSFLDAIPHYRDIRRL